MACVVYTADLIRKFDSKPNRTADSIRDSIRTQKNDSQVPILYFYFTTPVTIYCALIDRVLRPVLMTWLFSDVSCSPETAVLQRIKNYSSKSTLWVSVINPLHFAIQVWPTFLISDIRALSHSALSARVPECQKSKNNYNLHFTWVHNASTVLSHHWLKCD